MKMMKGNKKCNNKSDKHYKAYEQQQNKQDESLTPSNELR